MINPKTPYYYMAIEKNGEEGYCCHFPDIPGCTASGDTVQECVSNAEEVLVIHLEGFIEDKVEIPTPRNAHQILGTSEDYWGDIKLVLVAIFIPDEVLKNLYKYQSLSLTY